jgi:hypothetical protein
MVAPIWSVVTDVIVITGTPYQGQAGSHPFKIMGKNSPPAFEDPEKVPSEVLVIVPGSLAVDLPAYSDPDGHTVSFSIAQVGQSSLPSFVTLDGLILTIAP